MIYLVFVLLVVLRVFFILKPNTVWKYNHYFSVRDGEPTELYLIFVRLAGVPFVILGFVYLGVIVFY